MALRDQPYLPLYVQDVLTDEKLIECSALSTGVYLRLMCIMHKPKEYGTVLLKQKDKQGNKQEENFALKLTKQMPFPYEIILAALKELLTEDVIQIEGDRLKQKRMIADNKLSLIRAKAGKKGGDKTKFAKDFAQAKAQANTEDEGEDEIETVNKKEEYIKKYPDSLKIVQHFVYTLEDDNRYIPKTDAQKLEWLKVAQWSINQMGKHGVAKIIDIIDYFRGGSVDNNNFSWSNNWLSLKKLQNKNKEGVTYLDYFWEKAKEKFEYE